MFLAVALLLLLAPGYLLARSSGLRLPIAHAFALTLPLFFAVVFALGLLGLPLNFATVSLGLFTVCLLLFLLKGAPATDDPHSHTGFDWFLIGLGALPIASLLMRAYLQPIPFIDTYFRWELLAAVILEQESFWFYPPFEPSRMALYALPDGHPPLVSLVTFYLYTAVGRVQASLTALSIGLQLLSSTALVYLLARELFGLRAGAFAVAIVGSSWHLLKAAAIGHESSMLYLSSIATLYYIHTQTLDGRDLLRGGLTGLGVAIAALSRQIGLVVFAIAVMGGIFHRRSRLFYGGFGLVVLLSIAPWYLRNWFLVGDPLCLGFLGEGANPYWFNVHQTIRNDSIGRLSSPYALKLFGLLIAGSAFPLLGLWGGWRGQPTRLTMLCFLPLAGALWLSYELNILPPSPGWSFRMATLGLILLVPWAAALLDRQPRWSAGALVIGVLLVWPYTVLHPYSPGGVPLSDWGQVMTLRRPDPEKNSLKTSRAEILQRVPPGGKVLVIGPEWTRVFSKTQIEVVPVWVPQLSFLFRQDSDHEIDRRLKELSITHAVGYRNSPLSPEYFVRLQERSPSLISLPDVVLLEIP